jgi:hypothetical protein
MAVDLGTTNGVHTQYVYDDAMTTVIWLPLIVATPFMQADHVSAKLRRNLYRTAIQDMQRDGLLGAGTAEYAKGDSDEAGQAHGPDSEPAKGSPSSQQQTMTPRQIAKRLNAMIVCDLTGCYDLPLSDSTAPIPAASFRFSGTMTAACEIARNALIASGITPDRGSPDLGYVSGEHRASPQRWAEIVTIHFKDQGEGNVVVWPASTPIPGTSVTIGGTIDTAFELARDALVASGIPPTSGSPDLGYVSGKHTGSMWSYGEEAAIYFKGRETGKITIWPISTPKVSMNVTARDWTGCLLASLRAEVLSHTQPSQPPDGEPVTTSPAIDGH